MPRNIKIIGTSHISKDSIKEVKNAIENFNPDIVAIELDKLRFNSLMSKKQKRNIMAEIKQLGLKIVILNTIGSWIENKLGERVKVKPGSEMKIAIKLAKEKKKEIALIDQDIRVTLKKLTKEVSGKEKLKIFLDIISSPFVKKDLIKIDLAKVPEQEVIDRLILEIKKRYPGVYKVLIEDRNKVMAKGLNNLINQRKDKKVLAIIGAGHKRGVEELISNGLK